MLASTKTFDITELRERILLHATQQDLFLWQRINTKFRDTIKDHQCQKELFLEAELYEESMGPMHGVLTWNPIIDLFWEPCALLNTMEFRNIVMSANPRGKVKLLDRPFASWKAMFVSSPAVISLPLTMVLSYKYATVTRSSQVTSVNGVTMGDLATFLTGLRAGCFKGDSTYFHYESSGMVNRCLASG